MKKEKEAILCLDDEEANLIAFRMTFCENYNIFFGK